MDSHLLPTLLGAEVHVVLHMHRSPAAPNVAATRPRGGGGRLSSPSSAAALSVAASSYAPSSAVVYATAASGASGAFGASALLGLGARVPHRGSVAGVPHGPGDADGDAAAAADADADAAKRRPEEIHGPALVAVRPKSAAPMEEEETTTKSCCNSKCFLCQSPKHTHDHIV